MYVVKTIDEDQPDFKAFGELRKAQKHWAHAALKVMKDELMSSALFEVPTESNPYDAIEALKAGDKARVVLLELELDPETRLKEIVSKLNLEIDL